MLASKNKCMEVKYMFDHFFVQQFWSQVEMANF